MATTVAQPVRRGSVLLRVVRPTLRAQAPVWAWFWGLLAAVAVVLSGSAEHYGLRAGVWGTLDTVPRWFAFSLLVGQVAAGTAPHVANGLTRRAYSRLIGLLALATAVAASVVWSLGLAVENSLTSRDLPDLVPLVAEHAGATACYAVAGALVGAAYYRGGAWWGTLTLPLTVGPVLVVEAWTSTGWQGAVGRAAGLPPAPEAVALLLPVLVAGVLLVAVDRVLRRAAIRTAPTSG
ncbi:hypothetical protein [Actinotalea solisilvae]|uniref:hypothetical protein n=1 Tax=Actinotalea solisilvae TaxID=2072922 RepID=UPI0018F1F3FC|nr:hypothetical protein [Actinotalea solisilvae]